MSGLSKAVLETEFKHISGITYLDHAGATLYSSQQLADHVTDLSNQLYSNPHSGSPSSKLTTSVIDSTRELVLRHFCTDTEHYDVVFTAGCTAALNLLCYAFPWHGVGRNPSPGDAASLFCYLDDNHTSVVGMREVARQNGARVLCVSPKDIRVPTPVVSPPLPPPLPHHLFAYPAQSNFCGLKYPLSWCEDIPSGRLVVPGCEGTQGDWYVVLDAAALVSTSPLVLSPSGPHFVTLSFYKVFGFPTGLGALLVRKDCAALLSKAYYGGGTVKATDSWSGFHVPRDQLHDRLEDGTLPFLDILSLRHGFNTLHRLCHSMEAIQQHTFHLARRVHHSLSELRHSDGSRVCLLYCATDYEDALKQGPIVNFNLLQPNGKMLGYHQVEKLASVYDIHLRTGCFCNTGACVKYLGLDSKLLQQHLQQGHECGDSVDIIDGKPTGSVRVSFGYTSTQHDADRFLEFVRSCFVDTPSGAEGKSDIKMAAKSARNVESAESANSVKFEVVPNFELKSASVGSGEEELASSPYPYPSSAINRGGVVCPTLTPDSVISCGDVVGVPSSHDVSPPSTSTLHSITLYPVKSCAGFKVRSWPVGEKGLMLDREWMVRSEHGSLLSQKQEPKLCLIQPSIDPRSWTLTLAAEGYQSVTVPTQLAPFSARPSRTEGADNFPMRVCGDRVQGMDCGEQVSKWLTDILGRKCQLVRQSPLHKRFQHSHTPDPTPNRALSLVNEAQYLLLNRSSLEQLAQKIRDRDTVGREGLDVDTLAARFRANFVIETGQEDAYIEEDWEKVRIGTHLFQATGKCVRCQMVCVEPHTGERSPEPLKTLLALRGSKASFGIYLCTTDTRSCGAD